MASIRPPHRPGPLQVGRVHMGKGLAAESAAVQQQLWQRAAETDSHVCWFAEDEEVRVYVLAHPAWRQLARIVQIGER